MRASALGLAFLREAEELAAVEDMSDSPKNLAATCYLCMAYVAYGIEGPRSQTFMNAQAMATRMSLIDTPPREELLISFHRLPTKKIQELSHVAWGAYGVLS